MLISTPVTVVEPAFSKPLSLLAADVPRKDDTNDLFPISSTVFFHRSAPFSDDRFCPIWEKGRPVSLLSTLETIAHLQACGNVEAPTRAA